MSACETNVKYLPFQTIWEMISGIPRLGHTLKRDAPDLVKILRGLNKDINNFK